MPKQDCPRGDILLSLMYNPTRQLLQGTVMKIANLVRLDIVGQAGIESRADLQTAVVYFINLRLHWVIDIPAQQALRKWFSIIRDGSLASRLESALDSV